MLKRSISTVNKEFVKRLNKQILIDVRTPEETFQGTIPHSNLLPLDSVKEALNLTPAEFRQKFKFVKPTKEDELVFYCYKGSRSLLACKIAEELGYKKVYNYPGSWADWTTNE